MKHTTHAFLALATATLLAASCRKSDMNVQPDTSSVSPIGNLAKKSGDGRPFKGSMTLSPTTQSLACDCPAPSMSMGTYSGSGNLTHLGNTSLKIHSCVIPVVIGGTLAGYNVTNVCAEMIAANGDELHTYTHPYTLTLGPNGGTGTITIDFVGGTGNFAGATGSFTGTMTIDGATSTATFDNIDGTISY